MTSVILPAPRSSALPVITVTFQVEPHQSQTLMDQPKPPTQKTNLKESIYPM